MKIKSLLGTKVERFYYILEAFNSGDLVCYQELCQVHRVALSAQPALVENEKKLLEKINIQCLKCNRVSCSSYCRGFRCLNTYIGHPRPVIGASGFATCNCYSNCCR